MKFVTTLLLVVATSVSAFCAEAPWRPLFNGHDFTGWKIVGGQAKAKSWVEDGEIRGHMVRDTPEHTLIRTEEKFGDFILELDSYQDGGFNSGILFRSHEAPADAKIRLLGYQMKIDPSPTRKWTGGVFEEYGTTWLWLYTLKNDLRARDAYKVKEWSHFRIEAIGDNIRVWVNGVPTTHLINANFTDGYIALKIHFLGADGTSKQEENLVRFKNIRIITDHPKRYVKSMDLPALKADPTETMNPPVPPRS